jgi:hypothetical protein
VCILVGSCRPEYFKGTVIAPDIFWPEQVMARNPIYLHPSTSTLGYSDSRK